jgi:hypothetical protein
MPLQGSSLWLTDQGTMCAASTAVWPSTVNMRMPQNAQRWSYAPTITRRKPWSRTAVRYCSGVSFST